jgi:peptide deformylase
MKTCLKKNFGTVRTLGLSAPQVGILKRIFIMPANWEAIRHSERLSKSILRKFDVFINPIVLDESDVSCMVKPAHN